MNQYEKLLDEAHTNSIEVVEKKFKSKALGLCKGDKIGIRKGLPTKTRTCVLAEELGHNKLTVGNISDQTKVENRKQEYKARKYSLERIVPLNAIIEAYNIGCLSYYSVSEYLDIDEEFLHEAIEFYKRKYGVCTKIDNYIICFEPSLSIMEIWSD